MCVIVCDCKCDCVIVCVRTRTIMYRWMMVDVNKYDYVNVIINKHMQI